MTLRLCTESLVIGGIASPLAGSLACLPALAAKGCGCRHEGVHLADFPPDGAPTGRDHIGGDRCPIRPNAAVEEPEVEVRATICPRLAHVIFGSLSVQFDADNSHFVAGQSECLSQSFYLLRGCLAFHTSNIGHASACVKGGIVKGDGC